MDTIPVEYRFTFADGSEAAIGLRFDSKTLDLLDNRPSSPPAWAALSFHQCPHCPLPAEKHPACPLAANLTTAFSRFEKLLSYEQVHLEVVTRERTVSYGTTVQRAIGSMMGLVIATSGCPHTSFLKPMARFHLPLASEEETIYRAATMYLLAQYFRREEGHPACFDFEGLTGLYQKVQTVNAHVAERFRMASDSDSLVNAIIFLDMYAKSMPYAIKKSLRELRYLFGSYLNQG